MAPIPQKIKNKDRSIDLIKAELRKLGITDEELLALIRKNKRYTAETYVRIDENWTEEQINELIDVEVGPLEDDIENIQRQVDGQIETWFYNGEPGPLVLPESEWVAIDTQAGNNNERLKHLGDLYYNNSTGYAYRYSNSGTEQSPVFYWNPISDSAVTEALRQASQAQDTADHKRRIFVTANGVLPTPPYSEGDMWINAIYPLNNTEKDWAHEHYYNDILRCNVPATYSGGSLVREGVETGEQASISHWSPSSNYTDDTYAHSFDYFKTAMQSGGTQLLGGLILSKTIALRDQNDNIMAGVNGILQSGTPLESIAAWFGGPMVDHEKNPSAQDYAKILFRMNGSGYLAGGLISFDDNGALTTVDLRTATTYLGTIKLGDIYISPDANNNYLEIYKLDANNNKIAAGLCAYGDVTAMGDGGGGGGGGGASVLYELNDVQKDQSYDKVQGAVNGAVLMYDANSGYSKPWYAKVLALNDLSDVNISSQTDGQAIVWDNLTNKWVAKTIISGVQSNWAETDPTSLAYIQNKPNLATVATSGSYNDLSNKPTIPAAQVQANWNETDTSSKAYIQNKPNVALQQAKNNLIFSTNEFNFVPSQYSGAIYINYQTAGGTDGAITGYILCDGAGGLLGSIIHSGNIGSQSVNYATSAGSASSAGSAGMADKVYMTSHIGTWWMDSEWDGSYFWITGSYMGGSLPCAVSYASSAGSATDSTKLPLAGGTITGALTVNSTLTCQSVEIGNTNEINATGSSNLYIQYRNTGNLVLCSNGYNCGIGLDGSTNPSSKLDIFNTSRWALHAFTSSNNGFASFHAAEEGYGIYCGISNTSSSKYVADFRNNLASDGMGGNSVLYIRGDGNIGIGTQSPSYKLHVAGDIYATGDVTAASDERAKDVISNVVLDINDIANAPAIKFTWKDKRDELQHVGSIAQYWQKILPESVSDRNDVLGLNYGGAVMVGLVSVAKEVVSQDKRNNEQDEQIKELERQLNKANEKIISLENEVERLKTA